MFGFGGTPAARQDPAKLAMLDDEQLCLLFAENNWARLDKASRLALLQEVENRRAKRDGRPAIPVREGGRDEFSKPGLMGYYNDARRVICVNYRFLEGNSPAHTSFAALDVIVHEGRHAMQTDVMREHPERIARQVLYEWRGCVAKYFDPPEQEDSEWGLRFAMYAMQDIESDARRTAREALFRVMKAFGAQGVDTRGIEAQLSANLRDEFTIIWLIQKNLTSEKLDALEREVLEAMRERFPEAKAEGVRLFDRARLILNAPPIDTMENPMGFIAWLDTLDRDRLNKLAEGNLQALRERTGEGIPGMKLKNL